MYKKEELQKATLTELREIAEKLKIESYSKLKKEYLILEIIKVLETEKKIEEKNDIKIENPETDYITEGILEVMPDNFGFLRSDNYLPGSKDVYVSPVQIRRFNLATGDKLRGIARFTTEPANKFPSMIFVESINGENPEIAMRRRAFDTLIPIYPNNRLKLETSKSSISMRLIDIVAPIGFGQRGMIVAKPKTGKTTLLKEFANSISTNYPDAHLMVLLIDERPEEVTDMQRSINGEVIYSTFDESPDNHIKVSKMVIERAKRLVEHNKNVIILLDSLTRLTRASNLEVEPSGRTLSGGVDPACLYFPKKFFGAARNIENGGSLTILATALVETGSRMDDIIFEEFKGTGNMEVQLDRKLSERRIFPAIDIYKSGTRRDDLLLSAEELECSILLRKVLASSINQIDNTEKIIKLLTKTKNNKDFIATFPKQL